MNKWDESGKIAAIEVISDSDKNLSIVKKVF
jgi:hypothetical protein